MNILFFKQAIIISVIQKFRKESVVMVTKHAKFTLLCCNC